MVDYIKSGGLSEEWEKIDKEYDKVMGVIAPNVVLISKSQSFLFGD